MLLGPSGNFGPVRSGGHHSSTLGFGAAGRRPAARDNTTFGNRWPQRYCSRHFWERPASTISNTNWRLPKPIGRAPADVLHLGCAGHRTRRAWRAGTRRLSADRQGRAFFPVLVAALQWAQRWVPRPRKGPAMTLTHLDCGAGFTGELACDQCDRRLSRDELAPGIADRYRLKRGHLGGRIWNPLDDHPRIPCVGPLSGLIACTVTVAT